ncbi:MAG: formylglycine-generating enzyme family protein [Planctomycetes bacterium]|jgi:serine/threonine-protein kinase|nr:formylglycine-generating enzyme family protein [Planctomycetota bacterium]
MMKEQVQRIKEFIWQKYVDCTHASASDIVEEEAVKVLDSYFATVDPAEDNECYYLGILLFELAFRIPDLEKLYLAKAKAIFERYRSQTGETDWDVVEDRLEDINSNLGEMGADERAAIFARIEREMKPLTSDPAASQIIAVVEGMVLVPGGPFLSGEKRDRKELEPFYIDIFPVTNEEYVKFMEATGYRPPKFWAEGRLRKPRAPVVGISWHDADKYATWAGKSLPTADQWEKAARGLEGRIYPWGNEIEPDVANFGHLDGVDMVTPVDAFEANRSVFGVRDMAGNVWEWQKDWDPIEIDMKVISGGSWADPPQFLRCDRHLYANPKDKFDNIGFRCVRPVT